ncbi:MAG: helix-turn-helix domain-containing protein [Treponema sp.]|nr:helix-turn-helix domain-containing protein [Candidatus Treponema equifaecale]
MESYGEILRKAREAKNLDYDTVYRETSITKEYLIGLEEENVFAFPGEPYMVGFLKNYADFLGVDSAHVAALYHAKKLQESPPPAELTKREKPRFLIPLLVAAGVLLFAGLVTGTVFLIDNIRAKNEANVSVSKGKISKKYELGEKVFEGRVYKNDQLIVGSEKGNIFLTIAETESIFGLETPVGVQFVELSEEIEMDVDGDSKPELIVYVSDVSQKNVDRGAEVRIMLKNSANAAVASPDENQIPNAEDLPKDQNRTEVFSDTRAYPFTVNAVFRAGCLFRYRSDRKEVVEDYFANGDVINITSSNGTRIWMANGNAVKLQVVANGKTYDLGVSKAGEVVAEDIKWIKDTDGKYKVVVTKLD